MAQMGKVTRLPTQEQIEARSVFAEKPLTFQQIKALRDRLAEVTESCEGIERVLDQVEAVLRLDELRDMPRFQGLLACEFRGKLLALTDDAACRLGNLRKRIKKHEG